MSKVCSDDEARSAAIAAAVLGYLHQHPRARDTARGIHSCWLGASCEGLSGAEVEATLEQLAAAGRISSTRLPDGGILYGAVADS